MNTIKNGILIKGVSLEDVKKIIRDCLDEYLRVNERKTEEELVSVKEVAKLLNVDRTTLWRWEKNNYLLPTRIGHKVRYRMSEIKNFINNE